MTWLTQGSRALRSTHRFLRPWSSAAHAGFDNVLGRCSVEPGSGEFAENKAVMDGLVTRMREDMDRIAKGGGEDAIKRALKRGKLLVRDRINQLLDPGKCKLEEENSSA